VHFIAQQSTVRRYLHTRFSAERYKDKLHAKDRAKNPVTFFSFSLTQESSQKLPSKRSAKERNYSQKRVGNCSK
jgi:hypothetical protein